MKKENLTIFITVISILALIMALTYIIIGDKVKEKIEIYESKEVERFKEKVEIVIVNKDDFDIPESFDIESEIEEYMFYSGHKFDSNNLELEYFKESMAYRGRWIFKFKNSDVQGDAYKPNIVNVYSY